MFDTPRVRHEFRPDPEVEETEDTFARRCREPAELWVLARRRWRPAPASARLPRVVAP